MMRPSFLSVKSLALMAMSMLLADGCQPAMAQDCPDGKCFKTPVRSGLAEVAEAQPVRTVAKSVGHAAVNTAQAVASARPLGRLGFGRVRSYSTTTYQTTSCDCGCQSASSSLAAGSRDQDGALIVSVGQPRVVTALPEPTVIAKSMGAMGASAPPPFVESRKSRKSSRQAIYEALDQAKADGKIDAHQVATIKLACITPRGLATIEEAAAREAKKMGCPIPMSANGEEVMLGKIDWGGISDFLAKIDWAKIADFVATLVKIFAQSGYGLAPMEKVRDIDEASYLGLDGCAWPKPGAVMIDGNWVMPKSTGVDVCVVLR